MLTGDRDGGPFRLQCRALLVERFGRALLLCRGEVSATAPKGLRCVKAEGCQCRRKSGRARPAGSEAARPWCSRSAISASRSRTNGGRSGMPSCAARRSPTVLRQRQARGHGAFRPSRSPAGRPGLLGLDRGRTVRALSCIAGDHRCHPCRQRSCRGSAISSCCATGSTATTPRWRPASRTSRSSRC